MARLLVRLEPSAATPARADRKIELMRAEGPQPELAAKDLSLAWSGFEHDALARASIAALGRVKAPFATADARRHPESAHPLIREVSRSLGLLFSLVAGPAPNRHASAVRVLASSIFCVAACGCAAAPSDTALVDATSAPTSARSSAAAVASTSVAPPMATVSASALASSSAPGCDVAVEALLESNVFRGSPLTQATLDARRASADQGRLAAGIDHGAEYLSCTWRVRVNGNAYRYKRASHGGPASGTLRPTMCSERAEVEATAAAIPGFTDGCSDLHRGEYYGDVLEPIDRP